MDKALTKRELRENLPIGSDGLTSLDALERLRWDSSIAPRRTRVIVGVQLLSKVSRGTCRGFSRLGTCKYGEGCRYEHFVASMQSEDITGHVAAQGDPDAVSVVRDVDYITLERLRAKGD